MSQEAKDYDKAIKPYTEVIKKMDLNDLQLYMKLTDDMWKNIKGYGAPKNDFMGLARYDIIDGKVGVCRNFADHIATILNEVKPELNARTMVATLRDGYETAKIERNIIEDDETVVGDDEKNENINNNVSNRWGKIKQEALSITEDIVGNHVVTLVDCFDEDINKNVTLVIDPTNPGIGLYYNGEITMFNNLNVKYNTHEIVDAVVAKGGDEAFVKNTKSFLDSYGINKEEFEILANKYSLEAQNKALEQSREITQHNRKIEEDILKEFDYIEYGELYGMTDKDQMKDTYNEIKENVEKEEHDIEK